MGEKLARNFLGLPAQGALTDSQINFFFEKSVFIRGLTFDDYCLLYRARSLLLARWARVVG
ncbi:MAG: hypothetical protein ACR652_08130 [Methylocystis sp.]|uniref:hypothetical protein n=1 Tax=Methylocystis sp. TaxID=1911079 RepID=UPI003DA3F5D6